MEEDDVAPPATEAVNVYELPKARPHPAGTLTDQLPPAELVTVAEFAPRSSWTEVLGDAVPEMVGVRVVIWLALVGDVIATVGLQVIPLPE
jgi:hypothetical protein